MRKWTIAADKTLVVDILLFDQFSNHCLANTVEPFRAANTIAGKQLYNWRYLSADSDQVMSSSGLCVTTRQPEMAHDHADLVFIVPSYGFKDLCTREILALIRRYAGQAQFISGLDTGAWLLATAGLLDGKSATIHSAILDEFAETFPAINVSSERFVVDGNIITCGGAMAAFDLTLDLIAAHHGEAHRMEVEALFLFSGHAPLEPFVQNGPKDHLVQAALSLMDDNIETPVAVETISARLGCTQKELQRKFLNAFGAPPGKVYRHRRLSRAKSLLIDSDLPILDIAVRCGYENTSAMIRAFKSAFGSTPLAFRRSRNSSTQPFYSA